MLTVRFRHASMEIRIGERAGDKPCWIPGADSGLAWRCAAQHYDLHSCSSRLQIWILSAQQQSLDDAVGQHSTSRALAAQHVAEHWKTNKQSEGTTFPHLSDVP